MTGIERIAAERQRQLDVEGYDPAHDAGQTDALAIAGACYALSATHDAAGFTLWPWDIRVFKPKDRMADLVRAGALIAAAIDALSGAEGRPTG